MPKTDFQRVFRIPPSLADRYHRCSRSSALAPPFRPTEASERGERLHRVLEYSVKGTLAGRCPDFNVLLRMAGIQPASDEAETAETTLNMTYAWLDSVAATPIASEQYVATPPRTLFGQQGLAVELAGRLDLVARDLQTYYVVDLKTGSAVPSAEELAAQPSATIYTLLTWHAWRDAERVIVAQLYPAQQQIVSVELDDTQIEAGRAAVRRIVGLLAEDSAAQVATPGGYCAWCSVRQGCPAYRSDDLDDQLF